MKSLMFLCAFVTCCVCNLECKDYVKSTLVTTWNSEACETFLTDFYPLLLNNTKQIINSAT